MLILYSFIHVENKFSKAIKCRQTWFLSLFKEERGKKKSFRKGGIQTACR